MILYCNNKVSYRIGFVIIDRHLYFFFIFFFTLYSAVTVPRLTVGTVFRQSCHSTNTVLCSDTLNTVTDNWFQLVLILVLAH